MGIRFLLRHVVLRRTVTIFLLLLFIAFAVVVVPIIFILTGPFALLPGSRARPIRFAAFLAAYLAAEVAGLASATWLWLRVGMWIRVEKGSAERRQRYQDANYAVLARLLSWLYAAGARTFGLRVQLPDIIGIGDVESQEPVAAILDDGPLLVLSRHAGPGDSFLLVHALLVYAHRRPLIVLKDTLSFDPLIDVVLNRVPHCFISPRHTAKSMVQGPGTVATINTPAQEDMAAAIGRMAGAMGPADALLVFPEGANFTDGRRQRVIDRLRHQGHPRAALRAQRLRNVLPPHPNGVFAAIDGAPEASLVFVAHTGLDHMQSAADVWHGVPLDRPASVTWWTLPAASVPAQQQARLSWLQENWAQVDTWISREQAALEP